MAKKRKPVLISCGSVMIDPIHCGSSIEHSIVVSCWNYLSGTITLSDCDKRVKWDLSSCAHNDGTAKIQRAIDAMITIRTAWAKAIADRKAALRRRRKKKK